MLLVTTDEQSLTYRQQSSLTPLPCTYNLTDSLPILCSFLWDFGQFKSLISLKIYGIFIQSIRPLKGTTIVRETYITKPKRYWKALFSSLTFSRMISYKLNDSFYTLKVPTGNIVKLLKETEAWKISQWVKKLPCKYEDLSLDS